MRIRIASVIVSATFVLAGPMGAHAQDVDAPALYQRNCSQCHDAGINRAPQRDAFLSMTPERVLAAMETGAMVTMANNRTAAERRYPEGAAASGSRRTAPSLRVSVGAAFDRRF